MLRPFAGNIRPRNKAVKALFEHLLRINLVRRVRTAHNYRDRIPFQTQLAYAFPHTAVGHRPIRNKQLVILCGWPGIFDTRRNFMPSVLLLHGQIRPLWRYRPNQTSALFLPGARPSRRFPPAGHNLPRPSGAASGMHLTKAQ